MNVNLKFYDETKTLSLPIKFDDFLNLLGSLFGIPKENLSELLIFYHDIEGDKIIIGLEQDYIELCKQVNKKEVKEIGIEIKEPDKSIFYQQNIQEKAEQKQEPKNPQISNQFYQKEQKVNPQQQGKQPKPLIKQIKQQIPLNQQINKPIPINQEIKQKLPQNQQIKQEIPQNQQIKQPISQNQQIPLNQQLRQPILQNQQINQPVLQNQQIRQPILQNQQMNQQIPQYQQQQLNQQYSLFQPVYQQPFQNIPNVYQDPNNGMRILQQPFPVYQQPVYQQNPIQSIQPKINYNEIVNFELLCSVCNQPITTILYKCPICNKYYCSSCEIKIGLNHQHPLLKIRTITQAFEAQSLIYSNQNNSNLSSSVKKQVNAPQQELSNPYVQNNNNPKPNQKVEPSTLDAIVNSVKNIPNKISNFFSVDEEDKNEQMTLVNLARRKYDLSNFTDAQIEEALKQCNGNIDGAIIILAK